MTPLTTRFAPSPTGQLHLGHAYAAIVAFEAAKRTGGKFLVRIEDIDGGRARPDYERAIFEDLAWLGLSPDAPPLRQSERMDDYRAALNSLQARGLLYPCFCTRKEIAAEIAALGIAPQEGDANRVYPGTCRNFSDHERDKRIASGMAYVLRIDMTKAIAAAGAPSLSFVEAWADGGPHRIFAHPERDGDIVLARKDAPASYHLAVVVDDAFSGVTLVTRGEDLLPATHVQVLLQRLLDLPAPLYGHHPLVRDELGKRLAKRDKSRALAELRAQGWDATRARAALPALPDFTLLESAAGL